MHQQGISHRAHASPQRRLCPTSIGELSELSRFEFQTARLLRRLGYRVRHRPATDDLGVDMVLICPSFTAIVQCRNWRHPVEPSVVRDLYGTLLHTGADLGILARSK